MPLWKQRLLSRLYRAPAGEGGDDAGSGGKGDNGDTGDNGGNGTKVDPATQALIDAAVSQAVGGLKSKNTELLGKLSSTKNVLQRFEGIDPEAVSAILKRFGDEEDANLIKAGKIDEVLNKRTDRLKQDHTKELQKREDVIKQLSTRADRLVAGTVRGALVGAASKTGALPEAMEDIVLRGQGQGWTVDDEGNVVAMRDGETVIGKDGKTPLSMSEWLDGLRESAPHLWPKAQGSGASGSGSGKGSKVDLSGLSPVQRLTAMREQQQGR